MEKQLTRGQLAWLVILRVFIGWHFLFEGLTKVLNPSWSAKAYLLDSKGIFSSFFTGMAGNPSVLGFVDFINEWALVLIGLGLLLGIFARLASTGGIILLALYTMSHPSIIGVQYLMPLEGSYFLIDKNLVELAALGLLFVFPSARYIGMDRYLMKIFPSALTRYII
jgi:thiosulfate dehydrogenase [quinone] large subunit